MAKVEDVEMKIWDVEGFGVVIKSNGKDVHGDNDIPQNYYPYNRKAKDNMTVSEWKRKRFDKNFSEYDVDVLDVSGNVVKGDTTIGTVRDAYNGD